MTAVNVLIIDDNQPNSKILSMLLKTQGVESFILNNPVKLDEFISTLPQINIVFLDLEMPMVNGFQVMDKLRADDGFATTQIIAYSVHSSELANTNRYGFDGFIGKPIDSDKFPEVLNNILAGKSVWIASF